MTLPIDRTPLTAAQTNQVPQALIASALNIAAISALYDSSDEMNNKVNSLVSSSALSALGVYNAKSYNASGSAQTTTGSITTGTATLTLTTALDFTNGEGITVAGAGAAGTLLVTTIISGAGTTTLTLAANAGTTVTTVAVGHDDTTAINNAITVLKNASGGKLVFPAGTYKVTSNIAITGLNNAVIHGEGNAIISWTGISGAYDIFTFQGNAVSGSECHNILIKGLTINNAAQFGIQIYGAGFTYAPHDITIQNVNTNNSVNGGIFINTAKNIKVIDCTNVGGMRHVGVGATKNWTDTTNVIVKGCITSQTTQYGYQAYYGSNLVIAGCIADGTSETGGDKSCITIDRSKYVTVDNNTVQNAPNDQIFITGVQNVSATGNTCYGGNYGIQVLYNNEPIEDATIHEAYGVTLTGNTIYNAALVGIIFNGVIQGVMTGNIIRGVPGGKDGIYLMHSTRSDSVVMQLKQIVVIGNISDGDININTEDAGITFIGNNVTTIVGLGATDMTLDASSAQINLANIQVQNFGLLKRSNLADGAFLQEYDANGFDSLAIVLRSTGLGFRDVTSNQEYIAIDYKNGTGNFTKSISGGSDTTANRPTATKPNGAMFYDTTLGKPIWWNGTVWKDATGATV